MAGLIVLAGVLPTACSLQPSVGFSIQASVIAQGEALDSEAFARGLTAAAVVSGQIAGRLPCDIVTGSVDERGATLDVVIEVRAGINFCPGAPPTTFSYVASLLNVKPGTYTITVEYSFQGLDKENEQVLTDTIEVD